MPKKILLADDSITIQKVVELTFSEGDYQVFSVGNGVQALRKIHEVRPDVALLDVIMPEVNGYEVCEKVKRNPETSWIPVLLLTGTFEPFDRKRADAAGANGHLTKPFESQMLISKVEELIATSHHPVVETERLGKMEIVEGGGTRLEAAEPSLAGGRMRISEPEEELSRQSIVPDRFDESREVPPAPTGAEGVQTVRFAPEPIPETPATAPAPEATPGTWDELAGDLTGAVEAEPSREPAVAGGLSLPSVAVPVTEVPAGMASVPSASEPAPPQEAVASPPPRSLPGVLSAADIDQVAKKVLERISEDVIRDIAWEIIPELAESLIKQRIRELEEKITREN